MQTVDLYSFMILLYKRFTYDAVFGLLWFEREQVLTGFEESLKLEALSPPPPHVQKFGGLTSGWKPDIYYDVWIISHQKFVFHKINAFGVNRKKARLFSVFSIHFKEKLHKTS